MKKTALSLAVIAASALYVANQPDATVAEQPLAAAVPAVGRSTAAPATALATATDQPPPVRDRSPGPRQPAFQVSAPAGRSVPASVRLSALSRPVQVAAAAVAGGPTGYYVDGSYTGPAANAYYGYVQIEAIVQGGRITALRALQYPSDRRTSLFINRQALPLLRDEVIATQSANVDIISGATLTSEAFIRSLAGALVKARV